MVRSRPQDATRTVIQGDAATTFGEAAMFKLFSPTGSLLLADPTHREAGLAAAVAADVAAGLLQDTPPGGTAIGPADVAFAYQYNFNLVEATPSQDVELTINRNLNVAKTWTAGPGGTGTDWATAANWTGSILPVNDLFTDVANFPIKDSLADPDLAGAYSIFGLNFTAAGWNLSGAGTLGVGAAGIASNGAGVNTISLANLTLGDSMPLIVVADNTLGISSAVNLGAFTLSNEGPGVSILSGPISGTGNIVVNLGTLTLSGANTFSGGVTLNGNATLNLNSPAALGTGTFTINGGAIDNTSGAAVILNTNNAQNWNGDFTFNGSNDLNLGTGAVTLGGNRTLTINGSNLAVGGVIGDGNNAFGLTVAGSGSGILLLTGANTYTGPTVINAGGLLEIGNGGTTGSINSTSGLTNNGKLGFNRSDNLTFTPVISGSGDLFQFGAGTLTLAAANTYTGTTQVDAGTLALTDTASITSNTTVASAGNLTLNGNGTITGTLNSSGKVSGTGIITGNTTISGGSISPADSAIGAIRTGNLVLGPGAVYKLDFNVTNNVADKIAVTGTTQLNANSVIELHQIDGAFIPNNKIISSTAITSTAAIIDSGAHITLPAIPAFLTFTGSVSSNNYVITAVRDPYATFARPGNDRAVAAGLDGAAAGGGTTGSPLAALLAKIDSVQTQADYNAALNALSPEFYGGVNEVSVRNTQRFNDGLADYLSEQRFTEPTLRRADAGMPDARLASAVADPVLMSFASALAATPVPKPPKTHGFDVFIRPFGLFGDRTAESDRLGYEYNAAGFIAGVDARINVPWMFLGLAGGYTHSDLNYSGARGDAQGDTVRAGPFLSMIFHPGPVQELFVDASVTFGYHWLDSNRLVAAPILGSGTASASYEAYDVSAFTAVGCKIPIGKKFAVIPTASLNYDYFSHNGFTESGAPTGTNLTVASKGFGSLQSSVGIRAQYKAQIADTTIVPEVSVAWLHDYLHENDVTATFIGSSTPFSVSSGMNGNDGVRFGAAVNALLTKRISAFARYDGELESHNTSQLFSLGLAIGF